MMLQTNYMNYLIPEMMPFDHKPPNSYTPHEIALKLNVKPSTVYAWLSRKELRGNKIGHRRYITLEQLKEFYERRQTGEYTDYTYAPR